MVAGVLAVTAGCAPAPYVDLVGAQTTDIKRSVAIHYPPEARAGNVVGLVVILCVLNETRGLKDCEVGYESAPGWGFGAAALRVAEDIRAGEGPPEGGRVIQIIGFCIFEEDCSRLAALSAEIREERRRYQAERGTADGVSDSARE
jgi:hypothetical protein